MADVHEMGTSARDRAACKVQADLSAEIVDRIFGVLDDYEDRMTIPAVVGVLHLIAHEIMMDACDG